MSSYDFFKISRPHLCFLFFVFNDTPPTEIYTLSLHDALPISADERSPPENAGHRCPADQAPAPRGRGPRRAPGAPPGGAAEPSRSSQPSRLRARGSLRPSLDRKSTRLNSSHGYISYAVFCLKK